MEQICIKTTDLNFPHHWKCTEIKGHTGCICDGSMYCNNKYCNAYKCKLKDGSKRVPDGSLIYIKSKL